MSYDEFDDAPRKSGLGFLGNVGPKAAFFVVLIALSFMVGVVWKLYVGGSAPSGQEVPIIRADSNPFKVTPDDPGGMEIPHKDSTIFSSLSDDNEGGVENLLAEEDSEEPMPRSQLFAGLNTAEETSEDTARLSDMTEEAEEVVGGLVDDGVEAIVDVAPTPIMPEPATADLTEVVKEEAPKIEEPKIEPVVAPKPVITPTAGDYYIQLGSVKSADGAEGEWKKLQAKYSAILSGYSHRVESADLGAKGTFYRIQAGPVSKDTAVSACEAIKKIDANGCLLKKK